MTGHNNKRGFSLIETAVVLGVVGVVIGGIWYSAAKFYEDYKVNKTVEGIFIAAKNIQNMISIRDAEAIGEDANAMIKASLAAGVFPKNWDRNYHLKSPFETEVTVHNLCPPNHSQTRFFIRLYDIQKSDCIKIAVQASSTGAMAGSRGSGDFGRETLGYIGFLSDTPVYQYNFPISLTMAKTLCTNTTQNIEFGFGYTRIN